MNLIQTYTGKWVDPLRPTPDAIDIEDIAHALAMKCRFSGQCREFYSVAQHSVYVADMVMKAVFSPPTDVILAALLHDATEAYLPDVARPLKPSAYFEVDDRLLRFRDVEARLLQVIHDALGVPMAEGAAATAIHVADHKMLYAEADCLMDTSHEGWGDPSERQVFILKPWHQDDAKAGFLNMFEQLKSKVQA